MHNNYNHNHNHNHNQQYTKGTHQQYAINSQQPQQQYDQNPQQQYDQNPQQKNDYQSKSYMDNYKSHTNKKNVNFSYRTNILDNNMQQNGNILFERFPQATRINDTDPHKNNTSIVSSSNDYYLTNRMSFIGDNIQPMPQQFQTNIYWEQPNNSQYIRSTQQQQNMAPQQQSMNVINNIMPQYTRNDNLDEKSTRYYTPPLHATRVLPFIENCNDISNSGQFMKNTRNKTSIDMQSYTPNPCACSMPLNNNPHANGMIIPDEIISIDTRSENHKKSNN